MLRFYSSFFSLTRKDNYRCIGLWKLKALPKYGAVDGGFAFQDGGETHGAGGNPVIYFFSTRSGKEIHALFDSVCRAGEITQSQEAQQGKSNVVCPLFGLEQQESFLILRNCEMH